MVIGLGQRFRSDDGVGPFVLDKIRPLLSAQADLRECASDAADLLDLWDGQPVVYLVDALSSASGTVGEIIRIDGIYEKIPVEFGASSSHALGLAEAIELGRTLKKLPQRLLIFGIVGAKFDLGNQLSPLVEHAAKAVINELTNLVTTDLVNKEMFDA